MTEKYEFENVICENINELKNELYNYLNCVITDYEIADLLDDLIYEIKNDCGTTKTKFAVPYSTDYVNVIVIEED